MKRSWIKKRRNRPRPGRVRGKAMEELRRACFERDEYKCQDCGAAVAWDYYAALCLGVKQGHMAHIVSRGRGGKDELSNVMTKCFDCHIIKEHSYGPSGVPPCPRKPPVAVEETSL